MRIESPYTRRNGGYYHRINGQVVRLPKAEPAYKPLVDADRIAKRFQSHLTDSQAAELARQLGFRRWDSLKAIGMGWSTEHSAYSFPMHDYRGKVIGIQLRRFEGKKFAVPGSRNGLFGSWLFGGRVLHVCEGASDTAALYSLDLPAVGRSSCRGQVEEIVKLCMVGDWNDVVIFADQDEPGMNGARRLQRELIRFGRDAVVVLPPDRSIKDVRQWVNLGATRSDVLQAMREAS